MDLLLKQAMVFRDGAFHRDCVSVRDGILQFGGTGFVPELVFSSNDLYVLPGFADVHVHLREPGFSYKETIKTGTRAAARGGYTAVCAMPNLNPVPDSLEHLRAQLGVIETDACIRVLPYGSISVGELGEAVADFSAMSPYVAGFSDDGRGVQNREVMREAMLLAKSLGKIIVAHCEDNSLLRGGYIHDGDYCTAHRHKGICSASEWRPIARDMELVAETGCSYHVCHISAKESVALIREAKRAGLDVTCETAPHYLLLDDSMLQEDGRFKMNPPIRSRADREALLEGICDGTIDMIATDHAPHTMEEKNRGLSGSLMGVVGLETAFPLLYTGLVLSGVCRLSDLVRLLHDAPNRRFGLKNDYAAGQPANFTVFDLGAQYRIDPDEFLSMGRSTPFAGWRVNGRCKLTVAGGNIAYCDWKQERM